MLPMLPMLLISLLGIFIISYGIARNPKSKAYAILFYISFYKTLLNIVAFLSSFILVISNAITKTFNDILDVINDKLIVLQKYESRTKKIAAFEKKQLEEYSSFELLEGKQELPSLSAITKQPITTNNNARVIDFN